MREKGKAFFQSTEKDINGPHTNSEATLAIILNPKTRQYSLTSRLEYCGGYDGKIENTSISFDDTTVLEEAERFLQSSNMVRIHTKGIVEISTKIWNFVWNIGCYEWTEKKEGIISCDLTAKDGILQSFSYQVIKNDETPKSNQVIPKDVITRQRDI